MPMATVRDSEVALTRSWLRAKATSLSLTVAIGILILIALGFVVYGGQFLASFAALNSPFIRGTIQFTVVLFVGLLAFALLYNFAPNQDPFKWKWITPGSVIGVILWIVLSGAFKLYLHYFDRYAATYGSLGAVIILMLWLYLTAFVILIGGAINAVLD